MRFRFFCRHQIQFAERNNVNNRGELATHRLLTFPFSCNFSDFIHIRIASRLLPSTFTFSFFFVCRCCCCATTLSREISSNLWTPNWFSIFLFLVFMKNVYFIANTLYKKKMLSLRVWVAMAATYTTWTANMSILDLAWTVLYAIQ